MSINTGKERLNFLKFLTNSTTGSHGMLTMSLLKWPRNSVDTDSKLFLGK